MIDDIGSGALVDFARFGFTGEPVARTSIADGADLVLFSGDKLLGGPQAGIIAGKKEWIGRIEKDPLMRAFRLDKMTLAALETTLRLYLNEERALREVPVCSGCSARPWTSCTAVRTPWPSSRVVSTACPLKCARTKLSSAAGR